MVTEEVDVVVTEDRRVTPQLPPEIEPVLSRLRVTVEEANGAQPNKRLDFPAHDLGPWPDGLSLRREDLYDS